MNLIMKLLLFKNLKNYSKKNTNFHIYKIIKNFYYKKNLKKTLITQILEAENLIKTYKLFNNNKSQLLNLFLKKWFFLKLNDNYKYFNKFC